MLNVKRSLFGCWHSLNKIRAIYQLFEKSFQQTSCKSNQVYTSSWKACTLCSGRVVGENLLNHKCVSACVSLLHETASLAMFDYLVEDNDLMPVMEEYGLVLPEDLVFIKEQIGGPQVSIDSPSRGVCTGAVRYGEKCISQDFLRTGFGQCLRKRCLRCRDSFTLPASVSYGVEWELVKGLMRKHSMWSNKLNDKL